MKSEVNKRVAWARKKAGLTQAEAAERLDIKGSTYSQMERCGAISADMLLKLSEIFGVTPADFLFDNGFLQYCDIYHPDFLRNRPEIVEVINQNPPFTGIAPRPLSKQEERILTVLRNLPKKYHVEAVQFIENIYKKSKYK